MLLGKHVRNLTLSLTLTSGLALAAYSIPALGQTDTGQIAGSVTDPSGAVITGATVTVKNLGTSAVRTEHTASNGAYLVTGLSPA